MNASRELRYAIVTMHRRGYASRFVESVAAVRDGPVLAAVIFCEGSPVDAQARRRQRRRRIRKAVSIGMLGTLNGLRMRRWFGPMLAGRLGNRDIETVCAAVGVPFIRIPSFRDSGAQETVASLALDVAVSMGNGYIPRSFFRVPRLGMLNVHHELLPEYRGAQSVLWQLHDGSRVSGFSIHEMTERIDGGRILYREAVPITFRPTLRDTVIDTTATIQLRSIDALPRMLRDVERRLAVATPPADGTSYTTPGSRALVRIYRQYRRLRRGAIVAAAQRSPA